VYLKYATSAENADKIMLAVFAPPNGTMTPPASLQPSAHWSSNGQGQFIPDASLSAAEIWQVCNPVATLTQTQNSAVLSNECAAKSIDSYFAQGNQYVLVCYIPYVASCHGDRHPAIVAQIKSELAAKGVSMWREPEWGFKPPGMGLMAGGPYEYLYVYGITGTFPVVAIIAIVAIIVAATAYTLPKVVEVMQVGKLNQQKVQAQTEQQDEVIEAYLAILNNSNLTPEEKQKALLELLQEVGFDDDDSEKWADVIKTVLIVAAIIAGGALMLKIYLDEK
jgi:hypothetical protein